ncbi:hypothetical protein Ahy_A09g046612 isoform D [Arachis hypogaea]|uniref:Uncharacterized protein n=1 Tax=Arachis hypogaea TaxID=3818 RepID=A0A445BQE8_ARAHY|nr:hypothetical protein Ahy_A09g046612 isoform D [Arachis hypogaea]
MYTKGENRRKKEESSILQVKQKACNCCNLNKKVVSFDSVQDRSICRCNALVFVLIEFSSRFIKITFLDIVNTD